MGKLYHASQNQNAIIQVGWENTLFPKLEDFEECKGELTKQAVIMV